MNIILCGLPMSGKTTIGKMAAEKLGWNFIDTDHSIEEAYGKRTGKSLSCRQIFQLEGELAFRSLENEMIASLSETKKSLIAVGGGCLKDFKNTKKLREIGCLIYLRIQPNLLWTRVKQRGIPTYLDPKDPEKDFYIMAEARIPLYESAANFTLPIDHLSKEEATKSVMEYLKMQE